MKRGRLAFVFDGTWIEHLPMAHELISALQANEWIVDVYNVPNNDPAVPKPSFTTKEAYPRGKFWPLKQGLAWLPARPYDGFISSCGAGIRCAGIWARLHRRPLAMLSDEITTTASPLWRKRESLAHQQCEFTIVPDLCRWDFLRQLNALSTDAEVMELPNSPIRAASREDALARRAAWGLNAQDTCLLALGGFDEPYGIERFTQAIPSIPQDVRIIIHERIRMGAAFRALADLVARRYTNVHFSTQPVSYEAVGELAAAADIGIALYSDIDTNFALMGKASGKICYFLANSVPIIHESFENLAFISAASAGEAAHSPTQILNSLEKIRGDLDGYKHRAGALFDKEINPDRYLHAICQRIAQWQHSDTQRHRSFWQRKPSPRSSNGHGKASSAVG